MPGSPSSNGCIDGCLSRLTLIAMFLLVAAALGKVLL